MEDFSLVKNIIFDFGAVIVDIDIPKAYQAFALLSGKTETEVRNLFETRGAYADYESGKLSDAAIRDLIRKELDLHCTDEMIDMAWCSMLLHIPEERLALLRSLAGKYRLYLLSNTNAIHMGVIREILVRQHATRDLAEFFDKVYLSYEIGLVKPNPEIYDYVMKDAKIKKEESVFLDDNLDNVLSARKFGLPTIQVVPYSYTMMEILKNA
jgi:FMN phosphatase YigB (HAD superfamily)